MTQAEWYAQKALEEKERVEAAHALKMSQRRMDMGASPNSYSPGEKQAVDSYFREKEASRQFDEGQQTARGQWGFTDADGTHHAGGAEKVAEYDYMGRSDQGMGAAKINAEASKYNSDNTLKGIQAQAKSAQEIEREKQKYLDIINGRDNATKIRQSEIEWGIHKPDGTFTPGGRVKQAEEQGKAAAKIAEQNNQARIEQEKIKAAAKVQAQQMMGTNNIQKAVAGNPILARLMQNQIEEWIAQGKTAQQINEEVAAMQQGGQGTETPPAPGNDRSQKIRNTYQQRGMGV